MRLNFSECTHHTYSPLKCYCVAGSTAGEQDLTQDQDFRLAHLQNLLAIELVGHRCYDVGGAEVDEGLAAEVSRYYRREEIHRGKITFLMEKQIRDWKRKGLR